MNDVDQIFASLTAYGEALAAIHGAQRERRRLAANTKRRQRYAIRKATGTLPSRKPAVEPEPEYDDAPTDCYCHTARMPPCSWCENSNVNDQETP